MRLIHPGALILSLLLLCGGVQAEAERGKTFKAAWSILAANFYDASMKGLDWNAVQAELEPRALAAADEKAFAGVLDELTGRLKTSHTAYLGPDNGMLPVLLDVYSGNPALADMIVKRYGDRGPQLVGIGVFTIETDGKTFIDLMLNGSPAEQAGLRVGDEILTVDGRPFDSAGSFAARVGNPVALSVRRQAAGPIETVNVLVESRRALEAVDAATRGSVRLIERDGHKVAYVRLWSMAGHIPEEIAHLLPLRDADALVLDIRGIVGGGGPQFLDLLDSRAGRMCWRSRTSASCGPHSFRGRTVLLTDRHTRSAAEILAYGFRKLAFGKIVGERTAGAVTGGQLFPLPNGGAIYVAVSDFAIYGTVLEGVGVVPDIVVPGPGPYAGGEDRQLDEALKAAADLSR